MSVVYPLQKYLRGIGLAFIVFVVGLILAKIIRKTLRGLITESLSSNKTVVKIFTFSINFLYYFILFLFIIAGLEIIGIKSTILTIIAVLITLFVILVIIVAIKDFIINAIAMFIISLKHEIRPGDVIVFNNMRGRVEKLTLTEIILKSNENSEELLYIPASLILKKGYVRLSKKRKKNKKR